MVYAGGFFRAVSGQSRRGLVALDATSAEVAEWDPIPDAVIWAMSPYDGTLYVGGDLASVWNEPQANVAAIAMPANLRADAPTGPPGGTAPRLSVSIEPNPARTDAVVRFVSPTPGPVSLGIYDLQGRQVATVLDRADPTAGPREVHFRTAGWPAGVYFCRLEGPNFTATRRLIVLD
jgi:hypothetical protein